jgi:hypothetical protein
LSSLWRFAAVLLLELAFAMGNAATHAAELTFDLRIERDSVPANMRLVRVTQGMPSSSAGPRIAPSCFISMATTSS